MGDTEFGVRIKPGQQCTIQGALVNVNPFQIVVATRNRLSLEIQNKSMATIYVNTTNAVAVGNGYALLPATAGNAGDGGVIQLDISDNQAIWVWATALPANLCVTELIGV